MGLFTERDEETPNQIILGKLNHIEAKLDAVIKAMHDYDGNDEYGESSFEAFQLTNDYISSLGGPCRGHDAASWDAEEAERRMDIIGQNGNEGLHYGIEQVPLEILQAEQLKQWEDERGKEDYDNDIQDKHTGEDKKRNKRRYYKPKNK
jgi:hypothetical protein